MLAARTARSSMRKPAVSASLRVGGSLKRRRKRAESSVPSGPGTRWTSRPERLEVVREDLEDLLVVLAEIPAHLPSLHAGVPASLDDEDLEGSPSLAV